MQMLLFFFYVLGLDSYIVANEFHYGLYVVYHLGYFYVKVLYVWWQQ
jgi:hypothetical protein